MNAKPVNRQSAELNDIAQSWLAWEGIRRPGRCAVVLLHGILQRASPQSHIARHLARFHQVVMPDLRGRGETPLPPDAACDPATLAADVALLIEHLGLERVVVVGRNHGGVVGYHLAAHRPDLVQGLVLGDSSPEIEQARADRRRDFVERIPRSFANEVEAMAFYTDSLGVSESRARHDMPDDLIEQNGLLTWRHDLASVARVEAAAAPRSDWDVLAKVVAPTLVLRAQRRGISDATAARMREKMPLVEMQTIVGSGPDVFLGPGAEQTRGALDMFLMRLNAE
jgi:pimeloyl-ACP methyl ester carboxylesterase